MSKYYKAEDIQELITACEWRMTLAKERHGEGFVDYSKQTLDVDELTKRLSDLPAIEVSEDCISRDWVYNALTKVTAVTPTQIDMLSDFTDIIKNAPSVVPTVRKNRTVEQSSKVGRWKHYMGDLWTCTACGESLMCDDIECNNYCPNCGAKMKG